MKKKPITVYGKYTDVDKATGKLKTDNSVLIIVRIQ